MAGRPDTWMPLYWGDYLRDTMHLKAEAHGAYLLLIAHYWMTGGALPDDDDYLSAVARVDDKDWPRLRKLIERFFDIEDDQWHHGRIEEELEKATKISEARRAAGKRGGKKSANARSKSEPTDPANAEAKQEAKSEQPAKQTPKQNPTQPQSQSPEGKEPPPPTETVSAGDGGGDLGSTEAIEAKTEPAATARDVGTTDAVRQPPPVRDKPAERVADRFIALRSELWPQESGFPAPMMTLETQAAGYLDSAPERLVLEIVERVMRQNQAKGQPAPTNLKFCRLSMQSAAANAKQNAADPLAIPDFLNRKKQAQEAKLKRLRAGGYTVEEIVDGDLDQKSDEEVDRLCAERQARGAAE